MLMNEAGRYSILQETSYAVFSKSKARD